MSPHIESEAALDRHTRSGPRAVSDAEARARLGGISESTLRRLKNRGELPWIRVGLKFRRVTEDGLAQFIRRRTVEKTDAA